MYIVAFLIVLLRFPGHVEGGGCDAETGSPTSPASLGGSEQSLSDTGLNVRVASYSTSCSCGIITRWSFYTRRNGTVVFYAFSGNTGTVRGKTSVSIPVLSHDNYYEIPLSSEMWISVRSGDIIGFFTAELPMITYSGSGYTSYYSTGQTELNVGSSGTFGSSVSRQYALRAYIETGHLPMFTNLPYTVSIYSHQVGIPIITVEATDLDPDDVSALTFSSVHTLSPYFEFHGNLVVYNQPYPNSATVTMTVTVSDGCQTNTDLLIIDIINEPPTFDNLPATVALNEKGTGTSTIFTIATTDLAGDSVTCVIDTTDSSITTYFAMSGANVVQVTYPGTNSGFVHDSRPVYDLPIKCSDADNHIYSSLNVDITKNQPPVYTAGAGYLPASKAVGRDTNPLYTLTASDPEGDGLTFSLASCSRTNCPISVSSGGSVTPDSNLGGPNYDLTIEVTDGYSVVSKILSLLVSEELDFNYTPTYGSLPATIYVSENTPANETLFTISYHEKNTWQSVVLASLVYSDSTAYNTYFAMDDKTTHGIVYVKAPFDYETVSSASIWVTYRAHDGENGRRSNLTIVYVNVNEVPVISVAASTIQVDEGAKDSIFTDPGLTVNDPDAGDNALCEWSLDCGNYSKYFYISDGDRRVYLAREYDMDSGLSATVTCTVAVIDPGSLSSTATLTLSIVNTNDNVPKFPHHRYLFLQAPDDPFFTKVENLTASDADSNNFGSALGTITYSFDTVNYPTSTTFYQIDVNGILYVRDVTSFSRGDSYVFKVLATDSGGSIGTATISILFVEVETITTTTTERYYEFGDDFGNHIWLFIVCIFLAITLVIVALMVWFDPWVHDFVAFKLMRIDEWCRHKPKAPKRTVGKLTVTVNNKTLENDPDNALPWELLAKDANVPEMNEVQEEITKKKEKQEKDYMKLTGRNVFEKGKGVRPATEVEVHSSASGTGSDGRSSSSSPKYDTFDADEESRGQDNDGFDDAGDWRNRSTTPLVVVTPAPEADTHDTHEDGHRHSNQGRNMYEEAEDSPLQF